VNETPGLFGGADGKTPLSAEEQAGLLPSLATREELNQWERQNVLQAYAWALDPLALLRRDSLNEPYLRELHQRMFNRTWVWAGRYRRTEKNLGIPHYEIRDALAHLLGDVRFWIDRRTYPPDEIAIRLHHRLVSIHPFANGNGRHSRLMADVLAERLGRPSFSWGRSAIARNSDYRRAYIEALRAADKNDIQLLLLFARS
jgi:Fic-DOC domain mobile mystery protein B